MQKQGCEFDYPQLPITICDKGKAMCQHSQKKICLKHQESAVIVTKRHTFLNLKIKNSNFVFFLKSAGYDCTDNDLISRQFTVHNSQFISDVGGGGDIS